MLPRITGPHAAACESELRAILSRTRSGFSRRVGWWYRQAGNRKSLNVKKIFLFSFARSISVFPAVFLHGGIRTVQTRWYVARLRGRSAVIGGGIATRGHHPWEDHEIRTGYHLQAGMHYHCVPKCVLLYGQHRWSERENAVIIFSCYALVFVPRNILLLFEFEEERASSLFVSVCYYLAVIILSLIFSSAFANQIQRPFGIRYNPYTQSVEVLTDAQKITAVVSELRGDLCIVSNALKKIHEQDDTVDVERITNLLTHGIELPQDNSSSSDSDQDNSPNAEETHSQGGQQSRRDKDVTAKD